MQKYIFKRVIQSIITIFLIVVIVFFLVRLTGDPVAMMVSPDAEEEDVQILKQRGSHCEMKLGHGSDTQVRHVNFVNAKEGTRILCRWLTIHTTLTQVDYPSLLCSRLFLPSVGELVQVQKEAH